MPELSVHVDVGENVGGSVGETCGLKAAILAKLKEEPELSAKELASSLGKAPRTVERHIK